MILLGLIGADIIITVHYIMNLFVENKETQEDHYEKAKDWYCRLDSYMTSFDVVACPAYYMCLCHCIHQSLQKFQSKSFKGLWYHAISIGTGLLYIIIIAFNSDVGYGILRTCAMEQGS